MTIEADSATNKALFVIGRAVQADLLVHYGDEADETREGAMTRILSCGGAALDTSGRVVYSPAVREIAPRLFGDDLPKGNSDDDKCMRAVEIMRRRQPLARGSGSMAAAREAIRALPKLAPSASIEARLQRCVELESLMRGGYQEESDPNGE